MRGPADLDPALLERFATTFLYREEALLVDELVEIDREARRLHARLDTNAPDRSRACSAPARAIRPTWPPPRC